MKKHLKHSKNRKRKSKKYDIHNENKVKIVINNDSKSKGRSRSRKAVNKSNVGYGYREYATNVINNPSPVTTSNNDENLKKYVKHYNDKPLLLENGPAQEVNAIVKKPPKTPKSNKKPELKANSASTIKKSREPVYVKLPKIRKGKSYELSYEGLKDISLAELKRIIKNSFPDVPENVLSKITKKTKDESIHRFLDELQFKKSTDNTLPKIFKDKTAYSNTTFKDVSARPLFFDDDLDLDLENLSPPRAAGGGGIYEGTPDFGNVEVTKVKKSKQKIHQPSEKFNVGDIPNIKEEIFQEPEQPQHPFIAEPKAESKEKLKVKGKSPSKIPVKKGRPKKNP
jgi:hypothetical protein